MGVRGQRRAAQSYLQKPVRILYMGGGIVAVTFEEKGVNNRPCLDYLISLILEESKKEDIPFTKGVSFGFSGIRVSAASAMAQDRPPFLRFSIGEESEKEMERICSVVKRSFMLFLKNITFE